MVQFLHSKCEQYNFAAGTFFHMFKSLVGVCVCLCDIILPFGFWHIFSLFLHTDYYHQFERRKANAKAAVGANESPMQQGRRRVHKETFILQYTTFNYAWFSLPFSIFLRFHYSFFKAHCVCADFTSPSVAFLIFAGIVWGNETSNKCSSIVHIRGIWQR